MNDITVIQNKIYEIRGLRVMLDFDLAALYQVETKRLKEAVRRNIERFEGDEFMFELTEKEYADLRSQIATSINIIRHFSAFHVSSVPQSSREYWCYTVCKGLYPY